MGRGVEHPEADFLPKRRLILTSHNADRALKLLAANPQLAVKRLQRQALKEPIGRMKAISLPRQKLPAVKIGSDAVKLFAHMPASRVKLTVPALGQEQRRRW